MVAAARSSSMSATLAASMSPNAAAASTMSCRATTCSVTGKPFTVAAISRARARAVTLSPSSSAMWARTRSAAAERGELGEHATGLSDAPLATAQLGEVDRRVWLQLAVAGLVELGRLGEARLTLAPLAQHGEQPAIRGEAAGAQEAVGAAVGLLEPDPAPLLGAAEVTHLLARAEREAEGVAHHQGGAGLATGDRGHHLVEHGHALVDAPRLHEEQALAGLCLELQVAVATATRDLRASAMAALKRSWVKSIIAASQSSSQPRSAQAGESSSMRLARCSQPRATAGLPRVVSSSHAIQAARKPARSGRELADEVAVRRLHLGDGAVDLVAAPQGGREQEVRVRGLLLA